METKHTPGPWHLVMRGTGPHEIHDRETHFDVDGARVGDTANGIAYVERYPGMRGTGEANARLMAAAPELLDALEAQSAIIDAAHAVISRWIIPGGISDEEAMGELIGIFDNPDQLAAKTLKDAAIAKAKGE